MGRGVEKYGPLGGCELCSAAEEIEVREERMRTEP